MVVAAAGNAGADADDYAPANCDGVLTVAATDRDGARAVYSNHGAVVDLAAPGGDIRLHSEDGVYSTHNGGATAPGADVSSTDTGALAGGCTCRLHATDITLLAPHVAPAGAGFEETAQPPSEAEVLHSSTTQQRASSGRSILSRGVPPRAAHNAFASSSPKPALHTA